MVPAFVYQEDFSPKGYESIKLLTIRNTDEIASQNLFDIKDNVRNEHGLYIRVKDIKTTYNWMPQQPKKITKREFKQFLKLPFELQKEILGIKD